MTDDDDIINLSEQRQQYPRIVITRARWQERPDVWICGWAIDYQMEPDLSLVVETREAEYSADELYEIAIEYDCLVIVDDTPWGAGRGRTCPTTPPHRSTSTPRWRHRSTP